jgi:hypothetical protein
VYRPDCISTAEKDLLNIATGYSSSCLEHIEAKERGLEVLKKAEDSSSEKEHDGKSSGKDIC